MADLARVLPRHWDGRRLLRFLAGLAMLALTFTAPVFTEPVAPTVPAFAAPVPAAATAPVSVAGQATASMPVSVVAAPAVDAASLDKRVPVASTVDRSFGELSLPLMPSTLVVAVAVGVVAGVAPRVRGPRAPPAV